MMQIKKTFLSLLFILGISFLIPIKVMASEYIIDENQSDIAEQNSVIEEQFTMPTAGVGTIFDYNYITEDVIQLSLILQEETNISPYADTINSLTQEEKELICKITYREAGNQSIAGQRAVMEVILNRLQSANWPNDVTTVLSSPGQFSTWGSRNNITPEKLLEMKMVLELVCTDTNTILPNNNYVYFNCANPGKESIKIEQHWFWI